MKIKLITLTFLIALSVTFTKAQKPWTLSDCIDYAHSNNLQVKRAELQAEYAKVDLTQSYTNLFPSVNADISRTYKFGYSVNPFNNTLVSNNSMLDSYSLESSMSLFSGLQNYNNIRSSRFASLAAIQNVEKEKLEITFGISSAYLAILFQQELVEVAKSQQSVTLLQVERTKKLVEAGSVAKGDLLEIQAQLANENLNITNATNELNLAILNLTQLLDLDSVAGFTIFTPDTIDTEIAFSLPGVSEIYLTALSSFPHIKSAEYMMNSKERLLALQKGKVSPTLYLSGSLFTGFQDPVYETGTGVEIDYPYSDQFSDNIAQTISIGVHIPIFNRWEVMNGISTARIQMEDSKLQLDQVKQQLLKSIQQAHNDALSAHAKFNSAMEAVLSYKESFHYTEQKFNVGIVNSVEYNIAKNSFIKAESDLLQAKYEYLFAIKILDIYRGIPISL